MAANLKIKKKIIIKVEGQNKFDFGFDMNEENKVIDVSDKRLLSSESLVSLMRHSRPYFTRR